MSNAVHGRQDVHLPAVYELIHLEQCQSVLREAEDRAARGAPEGTLIWADEQADARGRLGARWLSPPGGLHCAVIIRPALPVARYGEFVPLAMVAMGKALAEQVSAMTDLRYHWPNAVSLSGGRAGGVWLASHRDWLVLASSVNVAATADSGHFRHACISMDGGNPDITVASALQSYIRYLTVWLSRWDEEGFAPVLRHFRSRAGRAGERVSLKLSGGTIVEGEQAGIDEGGSLRIATARGERLVGLADYMARAL